VAEEGPNQVVESRPGVKATLEVGSGSWYFAGRCSRTRIIGELGSRAMDQHREDEREDEREEGD
jgi:hypothetical protein